ncbi:putative nuclease HARBI1 [Exaiptasia diaphana]|nr:putative nuclease HARBI1 [Exaiptasia diaphana]
MANLLFNLPARRRPRKFTFEARSLEEYTDDYLRKRYRFGKASLSGSFLQVIGDTLGVDKATVSRAVTDVSRALINKRAEYIKWPTDDNELTDMKQPSIVVVVSQVSSVVWTAHTYAYKAHI